MKATDTATSLMERALALLDLEAQGAIACHLQNALDVARGITAVHPNEQLSPEEEAAFLPEWKRRERRSDAPKRRR